MPFLHLDKARRMGYTFVAECGCSSVAERRLPKPIMWVRFPSPAPKQKASDGCLFALGILKKGIEARSRPPGGRTRRQGPAFVKRRENAARSARSRRIFCKRIPITRSKAKGVRRMPFCFGYFEEGNRSPKPKKRQILAFTEYF